MLTRAMSNRQPQTHWDGTTPGFSPVITVVPAKITDESFSIDRTAARPWYHAVGLHIGVAEPVVAFLRETEPWMLWDEAGNLRVVRKHYSADQASWGATWEAIHVPGTAFTLDLSDEGGEIIAITPPPSPSVVSINSQI